MQTFDLDLSVKVLLSKPCAKVLVLVWCPLVRSSNQTAVMLLIMALVDSGTYSCCASCIQGFDAVG